MAKNSVNDNGLENNVPENVKHWFWCKSEIANLIKQQEQYSEDIKRELDSAREAGYTEAEIKSLVGTVTIPSWYLFDESKTKR